MGEAALRALVAGLEAAWNRQDTTGFAASFAPDAEFVHILGGHGTGRAGIEAAHRQLFATIYAGSQVRYAVERIRPLGRDAAAVLILADLRYGGPDRPLAMRMRPTLIATWAGEGWEIALFHNTRVMEAAEAPAELQAHPFRPEPQGQRFFPSAR